MYTVYFSKQAEKDKRMLKAAGYEQKTKDLLNILASDPFQTPPPYEALTGNLKGLYSRRINIQHRLVYQILPEENAVKVLSMWTHYERSR